MCIRDRYNTGKNVGKGTPTVFWDIVPDSDKCEMCIRDRLYHESGK